MYSTVKKHGKSLAITIPPSFARVYDWRDGDLINVEITSDRVVAERAVIRDRVSSVETFSEGKSEENRRLSSEGRFHKKP
jgi:antitoxin component of MazEF toxin-antitoxin module